MKTYIHNTDYTIESKNNRWIIIYCKDILLATVIDEETAYQVIYRDMKENNKDVEFITQLDFK